MKESNSNVVMQYAILNNLLACDDRLASKMTLGSKRLQVQAIQSLLSTLASAEYDLLRYYSSRHPKLDRFQPSAHELKGAVSRVVEIEWAKFTRFFLSEIGPFFKVPHLTGLNRRLVHVDARFKCENAVVFEIRC